MASSAFVVTHFSAAAGAVAWAAVEWKTRDNFRILFGQIVATVVTWLFAAVVTYILLKILDATLGLRVSQQEEIQGLDLSEHGEEGYIFI